MQFYPTPNNIVSIIRKHIPKTFKKLLEPSVGEGDLLLALDKNTRKDILTLIDIDDKKIAGLRSDFEQSELINDNFIDWSNDNSHRKFDLIVTNPPFLGKSSRLTTFRGRNVPLEVAFMELCLEHLTTDGVLIGIVPGSVINSNNGKKLRKKFFLEGNFKYVYELPKRSFHGIEGTFFVIVYIKGHNHKGKIKIKDLVNNCDDMLIESNKLVDMRLDYSFISSFQFYGYLRHALVRNGNNILKLGELGSIKRGCIINDYKNAKYIHTSRLKNYIQVISSNTELNDHSKMSICLKRVSRKANYSFSLVHDKNVPKCTDCILIITTKNLDAIRVIFSLRILYSNRYGEALIMKGSGAKFISIIELRLLDFIDLSIKYHAEFIKYKRFIINQEYGRCLDIEQIVFRKIEEEIRHVCQYQTTYANCPNR